MLYRIGTCFFLVAAVLGCAPATKHHGSLIFKEDEPVDLPADVSEDALSFAHIDGMASDHNSLMWQATAARPRAATVRVCLATIAFANPDTAEAVAATVREDFLRASATWFGALGREKVAPRNPTYTFTRTQVACPVDPYAVQLHAFGTYSAYQQANCKPGVKCHAQAEPWDNRISIDPYFLGIANAPEFYPVRLDREGVAKTMLHEFGHLLGLDDLYTRQPPQPLAIMNEWSHVAGYALTEDDMAGLSYFWNNLITARGKCLLRQKACRTNPGLKGAFVSPVAQAELTPARCMRSAQAVLRKCGNPAGATLKAVFSGPQGYFARTFRVQK